MLKLKYIMYILLTLFAIAGSALTLWFSYEPTYKPLPKKVPLWMEQRIKKELAPFKANGITEEEMNQISKIIDTIPSTLIRYKIFNNELYIHTSNLTDKYVLNRKAYYVTKALKRILKSTKIKNTDFAITMADDYDPILKQALDNNIKTSKTPPIFAFAANKKVNKDKNILFIDDITLANNKIGYRSGWHTISKEVLEANNNHKWDTKINKAFWRGAYSGNNTDRPYRTKIIKYSNEFSEEIDAQFTKTENNFVNKYIKYLNTIYEAFSMYFSIPPYMSKQDQIRYKMLINLDGHTCTYPGFLWRLLSNSVVLKQETDNEQWFYDAVKPWIHYVPVKQDMSDLLEKIEWIKAHDDEARKIAERSTEFVQNNLMPEHLDLYIVTLLNEYSKIQKFKLDKPTLPQA